MSRNPLDFLPDSRLDDLKLNLQTLFEALPEGWVFAGVMRRADAPFYVGSDDERYVAIATLESPSEMGPVPEVRGTGRDLVAAIVDLRGNVVEETDQGNGIGSF